MEPAISGLLLLAVVEAGGAGAAGGVDVEVGVEVDGAGTGRGDAAIVQAKRASARITSMRGERKN